MEEIEIVKKGRTNQFILKVNQVDQPTLFWQTTRSSVGNTGLAKVAV
jgi:hypothetical protein